MRSPYQIIADHYAASKSQDLAAMLADISPVVQWTEMAGFPCAGTYRSVEEITLHVFAKLGAEWKDYSFELEALHDAGNTVIGIGNYSGIYLQTGKAFKCRVAHVWQIEQGRITRFEQFTDTLLVARAMQ